MLDDFWKAVQSSQLLKCRIWCVKRVFRVCTFLPAFTMRCDSASSTTKMFDLSQSTPTLLPEGNSGLLLRRENCRSGFSLLFLDSQPRVCELSFNCAVVLSQKIDERENMFLCGSAFISCEYSFLFVCLF